jgi:acyl-CoA synthetase (AMP-forming)/AMP-acid ligase II
VFVTDQLPVLATGKIDKKQLRARYAGDAERRRE